MKAGHETPVNGTAARVMARGEHFAYTPHPGSGDSDLPLPTKAVTADHRNNPDFVDLTGRVVGRLKVVGLSAIKQGRWVCWCACGSYTLRKAQGLKDETVVSAPCDQCYLMALSKKREHIRRTGKLRDTEDFM